MAAAGDGGLACLQPLMRLAGVGKSLAEGGRAGRCVLG